MTGTITEASSPIPNIVSSNPAELHKTSPRCYPDAAAAASPLQSSCVIYSHIISRLTPQPPLPHTLPEHIPSLVGGVFHVLAEGSPQWSFHRRGLSHYSKGTQQLHIPTGKICLSAEFPVHVGSARSVMDHTEGVFDLRVQQSVEGRGGGGDGGWEGGRGD